MSRPQARASRLSGAAPTIDASRCPLCGQANACAMEAAPQTQAAADCWCMSANFSRAPLAAIKPDQLDRACLCPRCASGAQTRENKPLA